MPLTDVLGYMFYTIGNLWVFNYILLFHASGFDVIRSKKLKQNIHTVLYFIVFIRPSSLIAECLLWHGVRVCTVYVRRWMKWISLIKSSRVWYVLMKEIFHMNSIFLYFPVLSWNRTIKKIYVTSIYFWYYLLNHTTTV